MQDINLFDNNLTVIEFEKHAANKQKMFDVVHDISMESVNANNGHHTMVYQTAPGLQINNAFQDLLNSENLKSFCERKTQETILGRDKKFVCNSMWATMLPKYSQMSRHTVEGIYHGIYFLHSAPDSGMMTFYSRVEDSYFNKFGNTIKNEFNSNKQILNMPEGAIYLVPSYIDISTSTNMTDETTVCIQFILDIAEK